MALDTIAERILNESKQNTSFKLCRIGHPARMIDEVVEISIDRILESKYKFLTKMNKLKTLLKENPNNLDIKDKIKKYNAERRNLAIEVIKSSDAVFATTVGAMDADVTSFLEQSNKKYFDFVIFDEAGQSLEAGCLIAILLAQK